ncbi:YbaB/EbfC family nucleoid-associated protein [Solihabitans fulvus]|uniref:YbaB/EbfC family nucleoid-associated protein n=2 Tax=Solihabitans fulvus TaxID=1892852 RepID=A0A5B2XP40_9PSEU|nr:YbaB/EbfC family nucleoid-associated protein [Solihabitans fulvus]
MRVQAEQVSVTESSKDGIVTVTVDSGGNVTDLRITDRSRELPGAQVATAVLATMKRAQAKLPERLGEVMAATIGDDQRTRDTIVGAYQAKFPEPPPEQASAESEAVTSLSVGRLEDDPTPPPAPATPTPPPPPPPPAVPPPAPRRRPAIPSDEDDGWADQSFTQKL